MKRDQARGDVFPCVKRFYNLNAAANASLKEPALIESLAKLGFATPGGTSEEFTEFISRSVSTWAEVIRKGKRVLE